ncbi:MAG TPA: hypothetical protein VJ991_07195 [Balneolales bacterium]|nr:hypothetical protein [Balneolales bacterium]
MKKFTLFLLPLFIIACSKSSGNRNAQINNRDELVITTKDQKVNLVMSDSTIYMQLTKDVLAKVNEDLNNEKNKDHGNNWADKFSHFVVSNVQSLVNKKLEYPISEIKDITYEDGALKITYYHTHIMTFNKIQDEDKPVLASFNESDAKDFVRRFHELESHWAE